MMMTMMTNKPCLIPSTTKNVAWLAAMPRHSLDFHEPYDEIDRLGGKLLRRFLHE